MDEQLMAEIRIFAFNQFVPLGWLKCDGTLYNVQQYQALYALIGNTYGGTGGMTFAVPDLMGSEPHPKLIYCIASEGVWPARS